MISGLIERYTERASRLHHETVEKSLREAGIDESNAHRVEKHEMLDQESLLTRQTFLFDGKPFMEVSYGIVGMRFTVTVESFGKIAV